MRKYYVFVKETVFNNQPYFEVVTCSINLETMKFRRILNLEQFLTTGEGLCDVEEYYKGQETKAIDFRVRGIELKLLKY